MRMQHDALKWCLYENAYDAHWRCRTEAYGVYAACLPQHARESLAAFPVRRRMRQGIVPDFIIGFSRDGAGTKAEYIFEFILLHAPPLHICTACSSPARGSCADG